MFSKPIYNNIKYPQPQYQTTKLPSFNELLTTIPLPNEFPLNRPTSTSPIYPVYYYPVNVSVSPKTLLPTPPPTKDNLTPITNLNAINEDNKRKHTCKICSRSFTTSGHLARHNRIHTGERKHICPWPTCEARFARQDNCMQHYKTHTNGKKRKNLNFKNKSINSKSI